MKMFKTSVRGFKKSDVNNYIIELNKNFSDLKATYELEISDLKLKLKDAEEKIDRMSEAETHLIEYKNKNTELTREIESLNLKLSESAEECYILASQSKEYAEKLNDAISYNGELHTALSKKDEIIKTQADNIQDKNNKVAEQAKRIAELEVKLSDLCAVTNDSVEKFNVITAQLENATVKLTESENINRSLSSKNRELEDLLKQAITKLSTYESENATDSEREIVTRKARKADVALNSAASEVTTGVNEAIVESAQSCLNEFQQFADKVQFTSKNAITELTDEYMLLASRAAYYCDVLDSSTKKSISEFRDKANLICKDLKKDQ